MSRLSFRDIKKGDMFKAKCTGFVWSISKRLIKRKKLVAWTRCDVGCVEMEFSVGEINRDFERLTNE